MFRSNEADNIREITARHPGWNFEDVHAMEIFLEKEKANLAEMKEKKSKRSLLDLFSDLYPPIGLGTLGAASGATVLFVIFTAGIGGAVLTGIFGFMAILGLITGAAGMLKGIAIIKEYIGLSAKITETENNIRDVQTLIAKASEKPKNKEQIIQNEKANIASSINETNKSFSLHQGQSKKPNTANQYVSNEKQPLLNKEEKPGILKRVGNSITGFFKTASKSIKGIFSSKNSEKVPSSKQSSAASSSSSTNAMLQHQNKTPPQNNSSAQIQGAPIKKIEEYNFPSVPDHGKKIQDHSAYMPSAPPLEEPEKHVFPSVPDHGGGESLPEVPEVPNNLDVEAGLFPAAPEHQPTEGPTRTTNADASSPSTYSPTMFPTPPSGEPDLPPPYKDKGKKSGPGGTKVTE